MTDEQEARLTIFQAAKPEEPGDDLPCAVLVNARGEPTPENTAILPYRTVRLIEREMGCPLMWDVADLTALDALLPLEKVNSMIADAVRRVGTEGDTK
jgi:hypothetical protein